MTGDFALRLGCILTAGFIVMALLAPVAAPYSPAAQDLYHGLDAPSAAHPFGQDRLGRDIMSRVIHGARVSLLVGFATVAVSLIAGTALGAAAGYAGGRVDSVIMRLCDVFLAFPGILLAVALMAAMGPGLSNVIIALSLMGWTGYARLARGQALTLRERDYIAAARALGVAPGRIIARHLLPNMAAPLLVEATFGVAAAIVGEAGLSFLGLGAQPPTPSWGAMLAEGREFLLVAPHVTLFPGLAIMLVTLGVNFLGDGLRDWLDPKTPGQRG
ncbi:MAG: ABC transporter permease [Nitrospinae bacterium]|nr:ABC transporter permease [Nitrospinota bacterium]